MGSFYWTERNSGGAAEEGSVGIGLSIFFVGLSCCVLWGALARLRSSRGGAALRLVIGGGDGSGRRGACRSTWQEGGLFFFEKVPRVIQ